MTLTNENYVQKAEKVIGQLAKNTDRWNNVVMVTTSQLRNLLAMTMDIYNEVRVYREEKLSDEICGRINYLKIRFIYEAGRERNVKAFVEEAEILKCLDEIQGSRTRFLLFNHYMEALVAYHKFNGGKD